MIPAAPAVFQTCQARCAAGQLFAQQSTILLPAMKSFPEFRMLEKKDLIDLEMSQAATRIWFVDFFCEHPTTLGRAARNS